MAEDENAAWLFGGENGDGGQWEAHRRFISPEFNAIYRQGVVGSRHLKEADFIRFLQSAREGPQLAAKQFELWFLADREEGGDYGDVVMDRIAARAHAFDAETAYGVVRVFADVMDDYYRARPKREMFVDTWQQSESILRTFKSSILGFRLGAISSELGRSGAAISWMCSAIARDEIWGHGLAGDQQREEQLRLLSRLELQRFTSTLISRVASLSDDQILRLPRLGAVLFTLIDSPWSRGKSQEIINRLSGPRVSDAKYLQLLEAMAGVVVSSDRGVYNTISRKSLVPILGESAFDERWNRLLKKRLTKELADKRERIKKMMAEARNW